MVSSSRKAAGSLSVIALCVGLAACGGGSDKVKFSEKKYGVAASPRVVKTSKPVPKGGGRYTVGKPYKIAGKWYYPKSDPDYEKVGYASWYGPTFHGRKTANGEIFDRNALTAAHPTMPLPSYAKVTNLANGQSMVVRVNDRGPFHDNRVIDLSERVANMLGTKARGIAKVKVEYVGRAPLHGQDEKRLLASYSGNGGSWFGGSGGTMLAYAENLGRIDGPAPLPKNRPYSPQLLAGQNALAFNAARVDPAVVYEQSISSVQVASLNNFKNRMNSLLAQPKPAGLAQQPRYPGSLTPVSTQQGTIVLPPPTKAQPAYQPQAAAPRSVNSALSSFAPEQRLATAHDAFSGVAGGVSLKTLLQSAAQKDL